MSDVSSLKRDTVFYALSDTEGRRIEDLCHITGFSYASIAQQLRHLKKDGKVGFNPDTNQYFRASKAQVFVNGVEIQSYERPAGTSVFKYRDEAAMWERVAAIKRMKLRLIEDFHPLLDAIVADYEWMLRKDEDDDD